MKVTYEFKADVEENDYYNLKIFQNAPYMHFSLSEMQNYLTKIQKGLIEVTVDEMVDHLSNLIFESRIGEIE